MMGQRRILWKFVPTFITFSLLYSHQMATCGGREKRPKDTLFDTTSFFDFSIPQPSNKLGIFPTTIVQIEFLGDEELHLWRTNSAFVDVLTLSSFVELCGLQMTSVFSEKKGDYLHWGNCTFNENQITAYIEEGNEDAWNRNFTYMEIKTKLFVGRKNGVRHECVLNEFPHRKAYAVLATYSMDEEDGTVSKPIHKLDMFLPMALSFFEDIIEEDKILQFGPLAFLRPTPHYKCILGIVTGESIEKLRANCKFKCVAKEKVGAGGSDKDKKVRTNAKKINSGKNKNSSQFRDEL